MRSGAFVLSLLAALALTAGGLSGVAAQDATPSMGPPPDALFTDTYGLPELQITLTDAGFEGVPTETAAGWTVVTFTNDTAEDDWAVGFVQLPEGVTVDDLAALAQMEEGEASPEAMEGMEMATPAGGIEEAVAWLYETYIAGGPGAGPGQTVQGIVDLRPGNYAVWADDPTAPFPPVALTVTGEAAASPAAAGITADATITETGTSGTFDFSVGGTLNPGQAVIEITNDADQPHHVFGLVSPEPITEDQVLQLLTLEEGGTPPPGMPNPENIVPAFYAAAQSPDSTQYLAVNLEPGYYIFVCFVGDPQQGGIPHAFEGMIEVVPVGV